MNRLHIVIILLILAVGAAVGLSYQFYIKPKFDQYNEAQDDLKQLKTKLDALQKRFKGQRPEEYLKELGDSIGPLTEAAEIRAEYFNMGDYWKPEEVPEDVKVPLKFYYERQYREREEALRQDAMAHVPPIQYPVDVFQRFGAPDPSTMTNTAVVKKDVETWLTQMNYAAAVVRMLIKANPYRLDDIVPWPPREEFNALEMRTLGVSMPMRAEDLVNFLQGLQRENRYFNVNALRIKNRNLLSEPGYGPPYLEVELLLTLSRYIEGKQAAGGARSAGASASAVGAGLPGSLADLRAAFGGGDDEDDRARRTAKKSFWSKLWPF
ncbi:MAG: hypothetical protein RBU21_05450 [FCB group bacterium]|nr:hypothetical protein [FCB group bacterium]